IFFRIDPLRAEHTRAVVEHIVHNADVRAHLADLQEYDTSYEVEGVGRFRVNIYRQRSSLAVVLRVIPLNVPTLDELKAPAACRALAQKDRGLVLCVGAAGSGKS